MTMTRRKTHRKIEADELRHKLRDLVREICFRSRVGQGVFRVTPAHFPEVCNERGIVPSPKRPVNVQLWEYVGLADLKNWLWRIEAGHVHPVDPIPPLELLAREAE